MRKGKFPPTRANIAFMARSNVSDVFSALNCILKILVKPRFFVNHISSVTWLSLSICSNPTLASGVKKVVASPRNSISSSSLVSERNPLQQHCSTYSNRWRTKVSPDVSWWTQLVLPISSVEARDAHHQYFLSFHLLKALHFWSSFVSHVVYLLYNNWPEFDCVFRVTDSS